jgi:hypothetical protein
MKFNKWTLGLAALGVVSLASVALAEEKASPIMTALSSTTISGYVDTSAHWNIGTGNDYMPLYKFNDCGKADGFNLNVVQLSIAKPLDESDWAAGYKADLWFGPDANRNMMGLGTSSGWSSSADFAIRQAYVALRTPVGNGIEWKVGVFDSIVGYESVESGNNPNYTRSYGHSIEPQTHTGVLATYRFNDNISAAVGAANTVGPRINLKAWDDTWYDKAESAKTYMASIALTAPQDWGALSGSTLYGGVVNGYAEQAEENTTSWYVGATVATPVTGLKLGAAFDYLDIHHSDSSVWAVGGYASYQATEKLSLHLRGEYVEATDIGAITDFDVDKAKIFALTATAQYDLWQNVVSRLEFRWDHSASGYPMFGAWQYSGDDSGGPSRKNALLLAANIIYKF